MVPVRKVAEVAESRGGREMNNPRMTDAISRSALRETLNKFKLSDDCMKHEWAIQAADDVAKYTIAAIKNAPALDVATVVHDIGICTSFLRVENVNEWQNRIILEESEKSKN
jgi:hypothetical protein